MSPGVGGTYIWLFGIKTRILAKKVALGPACNPAQALGSGR